MQRRQLVFDDARSVAQDVDMLLARGCTPIAHWDLSECCDHLTKALEWSIAPPDPMATVSLSAQAPRETLLSILDTKSMPTGVRHPNTIDPRRGDPSEAVERLKTALERVMSFNGDFQPHPFFGRMSADEWRRLHLIHCAHHLSFQVPK
jgi:hypothetical protein